MFEKYLKEKTLQGQRKISAFVDVRISCVVWTKENVLSSNSFNSNNKAKNCWQFIYFETKSLWHCSKLYLLIFELTSSRPMLLENFSLFWNIDNLVILYTNCFVVNPMNKKFFRQSGWISFYSYSTKTAFWRTWQLKWSMEFSGQAKIENSFNNSTTSHEKPDCTRVG